MKKDFLEVGQVVGTHGVRGTMRVKPWSDDGDFLGGFKRFYLKNSDAALKVKSVKTHGAVVLLDIEGIDTIEKAEAMRGKVLLISREDAKLPEGRYFVDELIGCKAIDNDNGDLLGIITDVSKTGANDVWHITRDDKEYLVPAIPDVIISVDVEKEIAILKVLKGIFDDEN
ncbi:MAG: 16S rRNA processing protein RimM [Clostridia bacterium]|nr:16S rRNA processing protein RimM [Clostridia bacterium]